MQRRALVGDHGRRPGHTGARATALAACRELAKRSEDRSVSCAAAQVAVEVLLNFLRAGRGVVLEESIHIHDPSRRAEAALRTVSVGDGLLNRVQALLYTAQSLRVHNVAAVHGAQATQTTVDGDRLPRRIDQHHCANSTTALAASKMGARQPSRLTHPVEQCDGRRWVLDDHFLSIDPELDRITPLSTRSDARQCLGSPWHGGIIHEFPALAEVSLGLFHGR